MPPPARVAARKTSERLLFCERDGYCERPSTGAIRVFTCSRFIVDHLNALVGWLGLPLSLACPDVRFLSDAVNAVLYRLGVDYALPPFDYLLPVGISFYVFQSISYTIDAYRGRQRFEPSFSRYATFVSLFPQLVAGPIERSSHLRPQLSGARVLPALREGRPRPLTRVAPGWAAAMSRTGCAGRRPQDRSRPGRRPARRTNG